MLNPTIVAHALFLVMVVGREAVPVEPFAVVAVLKDEKALAGAHDVELQGRYAFVCGKGGSLAIINVAEPMQPTIVWSRRSPQTLDDAETVLPAGEYLFVGTRDFVSLNIRNPHRPQFLHTLRDRPRIDRLNGFVRRGDLIIAANKEGRIDVFDVSSPSQPTLVGSRNVAAQDGIGQPHDLDLLGDLLVVVDPAGFGRRRVPGKVAVYRIIDDATAAMLPPEQWVLAGTAESPQLVGGNRLRTAGRYAFVAASVSLEAVDRNRRQACVGAVDVTTPDRPVVAAAVPFPDARGPNGMCVAGQVVFVTGGQTVMAVNVSDPGRPRRLAAIRCTEVFNGEPGLDDGHDLVYRDGYLFVTAQTTHAFGVLRVDDPRIRGLAERRR